MNEMNVSTDSIMKKMLFWGFLGLCTLGATNWLALKRESHSGIKNTILKILLVHFCGLALILNILLNNFLPFHPGKGNLEIQGDLIYFFLFSIGLFCIYIFISGESSKKTISDNVTGFLALLPCYVLPINLYGFYLGYQQKDTSISGKIYWYDYLVVLVSLVILIPESYLAMFLFLISLTCQPSNPGGCP